MAVGQARLELGHAPLEVDDLRRGARRVPLGARQVEGTPKLGEIPIAVDPTATGTCRLDETGPLPIVECAPVNTETLGNLTN
jgi:hypothetical protein